MKIQLETITNNAHQSFSMMFNPRLSDLFYWHFHPEYELVFIKAERGTRHVGDHISEFHGSDLVLIGSNIPHLNFDYGITSAYQKVVVHFKKDFVEKHILGLPELSTLLQLFQQSKYGVAFNGSNKEAIGQSLFSLEDKNPLDQYLKLIEILRIISELDDTELLHEYPYSNEYNIREQERLRLIHSYVDENYQRKIELEEVARISNMTKEAFCRYFKKTTKYTFIEFLHRYRISQSKRLLMSGRSVSDACYDSGFDSLSYHNRIFKRVTDENPSDFRKRYL